MGKENKIGLGKYISEPTQIYLAGDMLLHSAILKREQEKREIQGRGLVVYAPHDDKEINDKKNQTQETNNNLAERIVYKDTQGIKTSDIIVIEPLSHAQGTLVEMGQVKGMRDMALDLEPFIDKLTEKLTPNELDKVSEELSEIYLLLGRNIHKEVFVHYGDIRRTEIPEAGDRRSWGINQYVYGVIIDLQKKGIQEFNEILQDLSWVKAKKKILNYVKQKLSRVFKGQR